MELKEFIKKSLVDIVSGIKEAQEELKDSGAIINPSAMLIDSNGEKTIDPNINHSGRLIEKVEMNIAVTTSSDAGSGLKIAVFELGGKLSSEQVSNIKFNIPVSFPTMDVQFTPKKPKKPLGM